MDQENKTTAELVTDYISERPLQTAAVMFALVVFGSFKCYEIATRKAIFKANKKSIDYLLKKVTITM